VFTHFFSEEDIAAAKAAVYFLEVVVNHKNVKKLFVTNFLIKLVLMTLSRIYPSQENYDKLQNDAAQQLRTIIQQASNKICRQNHFEFDNEQQRFDEIKVHT